MAVFDEAWVAGVLGVFQFSLRPEHPASRAGIHSGDNGRGAWVGRQRTRTGTKLANKYVLSVANAPKRSQGGIFRRSRRRYRRQGLAQALRR